jgi:hypothetical protein
MREFIVLEIAAATASLQPSTIRKSYDIIAKYEQELLPSDFEELKREGSKLVENRV